MNKAHHDRIAFMRICSGKFGAHGGLPCAGRCKNIKLATGTPADGAGPRHRGRGLRGDIIGLFDPGIFSIGDTLCTGKRRSSSAGIPTFSPGALCQH